MAVGEMLQGWNAIAEFLNCDERTAKRWETERGLPVRRTRRTPGEGRANVYALVSEIEDWRARSNPLDSPTSPPLANEIESNPAQAPQPGPGPQAPQVHQLASPAHEPSAARSGLSTAAVIVVAISIVFAASLTLLAHERGSRKPVAIASPATSAHPLPRASSAAVQDLYLHATYLLEQRTPETLTQSKDDFEKTIAADPDFAPAYAGLAETYDLLREYSTLPSREAYPKAKQAAERAIALDPQLADAHAALGYEEFFWEWDPVRAESEFRRAISLDPKSATAAHWYGAMLLHETRYTEAIEQLDRAQILEPASTSVLATRAYAIGLSGRRDEAVDLLQDILSRVPDAAPLHFILAQLCLQHPRDIPRYLDQERRYSELRHNTEELKLLDAAQAAYQHKGEQAMWRTMLATEQQLHPHETTYRMALLEANLGMHDAVLQDLERLRQQHNDFMIGLAIDTTMEPLRSDPGFQAIERKIGLPVTQLASK